MGRKQRTASTPGPKPKIGPAEEKQVYAVLKTGGSLNDAADVLGLGRRTLNDRMAESAEFRKGVDRAASEGKLRLLRKVGTARPWQAAAWMLERKWGAEYGKKDTIEHKGTVRLLPMKLDGGRDVGADDADGLNGHGSNGHAAGDAGTLPPAGGSDPLPGPVHRH